MNSRQQGMMGSQQHGMMDSQRQRSKLDFLGKVQIACLLAYAASLPISMTLSWGLLIAGIVLLILQSALSLAARGKYSNPIGCLSQAPLLMPILLLAAAVAVSGLVNGGILEAMASVWTLKGLICYFWAYWVFNRDQRTVHAAVFILLSVGAIAGVFGTVQQIANFHPFGYHYLQGTGFLGGPMSFAGQMQMLSTLSLALVFIQPDPLWTWTHLNSRTWFQAYLLLLAIGNCLGVISAAERSGWLGFVIGLAAMTIAVSWRYFAIAFSGLSLFAISGWFLLPVFQKRLMPLLSWQNEVSVLVRFFLWRQAILLWRHNPIFGVGLRKFPHFNIPEAIVPGRSIDINHAHSNYLQILSTTGVVGLLAYLWLWWRVLLSAWSNYCKRAVPEASFERALALGIFGGTIALLTSGIFEYNFGAAHVRLMQWFLLAMLLPVVPGVNGIDHGAVTRHVTRDR